MAKIITNTMDMILANIMNVKLELFNSTKLEYYEIIINSNKWNITENIIFQLQEDLKEKEN